MRVLVVWVALAFALPVLANHDGTPLDLEEWEQSPTCDEAVYLASYNNNKEALLAKAALCRQGITNYRYQPWGPPTKWETFLLMCKGACMDYYFHALEVNTAGGCVCKPYAASEKWERFVEREDPMCFKYPIEMFCEIHGGICETHAYYHRHTCRGCGWEAYNEDQWREERDPDFGCGALSLAASAWVVVIATVLGVALLGGQFLDAFM